MNASNEEGLNTTPQLQPVGLEPELVRAVQAALDEDDADKVRRLAEPLHYSDAADLIERLDPEQRGRLVEALRPRFDPEILVELEDSVRDQVIQALGFADLAAAVDALDSDDAVWLLSQIDEPERSRIIEALGDDQRALIRQGLAFPEDSAGRLMQRELVAVPAYWTVGDAISWLNAARHIPDEFYDLFVVDPRHRPLGRLGLSQLLRARRTARLSELLAGELRCVDVGTDQEDVAMLFRNHDLVSAPVVDGAGRLVGVITIDDVVDVIDEEASEDLYRMAGVAGGDIYRATRDTVRLRFSWLLVNLGTAFLASWFIGLFQDAIEKVVALAVLMPIVASMGGNAGTQTLAVAVRALAMKELSRANATRVVGKELLVGFINGLLFSVIVGLAAWGWFGDPVLGAVIGAAMVVNLVVAGLFGVLIPLGLDATGIDPAVASSVFLTTVTDVVGFVAFLALASAFLV